MDTNPRLKLALEAYVDETLSVFREAIGHADVPLHTYYIFRLLPAKGTTTVSYLSKQVDGLTDASVTRNLQILAGHSKTRKDGGFDLVEYQEDPKDRRYKLYSLNSKGRDLRDKMHERGLKRYAQILGSDF